MGARPNFMKVAPVMRALAARGGRFEQRLVHTGQHYDEAMSQVFFDELGIAPPDENLEVGSGSHAAQTAEIMLRFEPVLEAFRPDWLVVVGDVNSTMAATLVAAKLGVQDRARRGRAALVRPRACPRRSTGSSPTRSPTCCSRRARTRTRTCAARASPTARIRQVGNVMIDTLVGEPRAGAGARGPAPARASSRAATST